MKKPLLLCLMLCLLASARAQEMPSNRKSLDKIARSILPATQRDSTATALVPDTAQTTAPARRPGLIRRIIDYYSGSNVDRTFEKKIDWSIAPGPNYSSDVGFGIGFLVAGLYRLDRTDSLTAPSNISLYGNITTEKFLLARFSGENILSRNRHRLSYSGAFVYFPGAFYGVGYDQGALGYVESLTTTIGIARIAACTSFIPHTYIGVSFGVNYSGASTSANFASRSQLEAMGEHYGELSRNDRQLYDAFRAGYFDPDLATPFTNYIERTGERKNAFNAHVGIFAQYDTRDVLTAPSKGLFAKVEARIFPRFLGNSRETFGKVNVQVDAYVKLWKGMVLAYDLYTEFTVGRPSWHLYAKLGGTERMRGYYEGRYRDNNLVTTQVELRQKIYRRHGLAAWFGLGNIWGQDNFQWRNTLHSFGVGYRFEFKNRMNIRLDYGWGVYGNPHFYWDRKRSSAFIFTASEAF